MGKTYQEKVIQALMQDHQWAEQMTDVLVPSYLSLAYLEAVVSRMFAYRTQYRSFPTAELLEVMVSKDDSLDDVVRTQAAAFFSQIRDAPLNGDIHWVKESSLEFCRRQSLIGAMRDVLDRVEDRDYGSIYGIVKDALEKGAPRDTGHEYVGGLAERVRKDVRKPIRTGWDVVDRELNGGWERKTLSTFIAPTGAGKSMFLVNVAAAALAQGYNVLYCTMEMADYKIGLRVDSYFTGVPINDVCRHTDEVERKVAEVAKGRLFIKEWPTKAATVATVRAHVQMLEVTRKFRPDFIIIDYADLLRASRQFGEKRHELQSVYEELRGLSQELDVVMVTADQTNRSGMDSDVVSISQIGEAYAKAEICDLIMTISRRTEDKAANVGRLFIAKSRLGRDGVIYNFTLDPSTVRVRVLEQSEDPISAALRDPGSFKDSVRDRFHQLMGRKERK